MTSHDASEDHMTSHDASEDHRTSHEVSDHVTQEHSRCFPLAGVSPEGLASGTHADDGLGLYGG